MAFCVKGKCLMTGTSPTGLDQCVKCGRVEQPKVVPKGKTKRSRRTKSKGSNRAYGWEPKMTDVRKRANFLKSKQDSARRNRG